MNRREIGAKYEKAAVEYLRRHGYKIIVTNYRFGRNEIDIICSKEKALVFVEVKGDASGKFGDAVYRVDGRKQEAIAQVAKAFVQGSTIAYDSYRFDVIIVNDSQGELEIKQLEAAFTL